MLDARKSAVFTVYNMSRVLANRGLMNRGKLNRALGIVMRRDHGMETLRKYRTTTETCGCPDFDPEKGHAITCKHQLALMLMEVAAGLERN